MTKMNGNVKDITGMKFGKLTALLYDGGSQWICRCECGSLSRYYSYSLRKGISRQCYHCAKPNLIGRKFGELEAVKYIDFDEDAILCKHKDGTHTIEHRKQLMSMIS